MNEYEKGIWNELMKLPKDMLFHMFIHSGIRTPGKVEWHGSQDDLAQVLARWMAKRDFMRKFFPEEEK